MRYADSMGRVFSFMLHTAIVMGLNAVGRNLKVEMVARVVMQLPLAMDGR